MFKDLLLLDNAREVAHLEQPDHRAFFFKEIQGVFIKIRRDEHLDEPAGKHPCGLEVHFF